mgnify:CR=1 FL=1
MLHEQSVDIQTHHSISVYLKQLRCADTSVTSVIIIVFFLYVNTQFLILTISGNFDI